MKKYGLAGSAFGIIVMMQGADNASSFPKPKEPCLITATGVEVVISPDFIKRSATLLNMMDTTENQQLKVPMPFTDDASIVSKFVALVESPADGLVSLLAHQPSQETSTIHRLFDFFDIKYPYLSLLLEQRIRQSIEEKKYTVGSLPPDLEQRALAKFFTIQHLSQSTGRIKAVAISADGRTALAKISGSKQAEIIDVATGKINATIACNEVIKSIALSSDGRRAIVGTRNGNVIIIDAATGKKLHVVQSKDCEIRTLAISADGNKAVINAEGTTAKIIDVPTGQILHVIQFKDFVDYAALSADGSISIIRTMDGAAKIIEAATGKTLHTIGFAGGISSLAISADGTKAIVGAHTDAKIIDVCTNTILHTLSFTSIVNSVAISADGTRALAGAADRAVKIIDVNTGQELRSLRFGEHTSTRELTMSADGRRVLLGSDDKTEIIDVRTGKTVYSSTFNGETTCVALSADGSSAITGSGGRYSHNIMSLMQLVTSAKHLELVELQELYTQRARIVKPGYTPLDKLKDFVAAILSRQDKKSQ